jgi:hypothetical protein
MTQLLASLTFIVSALMLFGNFLMAKAKQSVHGISLASAVRIIFPPIAAHQNGLY